MPRPQPRPTRRSAQPREVEGAGDPQPGSAALERQSREVEGADARVAALAARQHGVADRPQVLAVGLSPSAIKHRLRNGRLHLLHRGVYAVGHAAVSPLGRDLAAVLACGRGAVLSHRSAAVLWGLLPRTDGPVEVTRRGGGTGPRPGIALHRCRDLPPEDCGWIEGVPVTSAERTILDLASIGAYADTERALNEARLRRLVVPDRLLIRSADRPGAAVMRALLAEEPALTRSEAERLLLALVRRAGLPRPATNVRIGRWEVDALWQQQRTIVEVDGYQFHSGRAEFERDRRKDAELQAAGYRVLRITWRQLTKQPEAAAITLAALLTTPPRPSP